MAPTVTNTHQGGGVGVRALRGGTSASYCARTLPVRRTFSCLDGAARAPHRPCMTNAARRATSAQILERFPLAHQQPANEPPRGILEARDVEVLGRPALLTIERVARGRLRATVAVRVLGREFGSALPLGREVADEAHRIAREAVAGLGAQPTHAGIWGVGFTVEGTEP